MIDCLPQPRVAPAVEEPLHRRKRRKLLGQLAPLAAGRQDVKHGVDHRTQFRGPWPPQSIRRRQSFDQLPFPIADIACIAQIITAILRSSGFGPHLVSPVYLANQTDTQVTEITQFILGQPLTAISATPFLTSPLCLSTLPGIVGELKDVLGCSQQLPIPAHPRPPNSLHYADR